MAEILALQAVGFIAGDEKALRTLLNQTGISGADMHAAAANREFQAGVLDFLLRHEGVLIAFCESEGVAPADPARAHAALSAENPEMIR